jgi:hypothetical protein
VFEHCTAYWIENTAENLNHNIKEKGSYGIISTKETKE